MPVVIVGNVELDGGAGTVAVQQIIDAAFRIHDEGHGDQHQIEFFAKIFLDEVLDGGDGQLGLFG